MDLFEAIKKRRSIRRYTDKPVPAEVIDKALEAALLAPNSSNAQTWNFYWVQTPDLKAKLVHYCLNQSAARTAAELIVAVASPKDWKRSQPELAKYVNSINAPKPVILYYEKLFPYFYKAGFLNLIGITKKIGFFIGGFFKPIPRGPSTLSEIQTVCLKSVSLACQNFVLAITAQGYQSCMMEGFDEVRVKKLLKLRYSDRVCMVIAVGDADPQKGTWGPQFRIDSAKVIHKV